MRSDLKNLQTKYPPVTVVIPVYNCGPEVAKAIASSLKQLEVQTEVIVVDDGSDAEPQSLLMKVAAQHSNVKVIRQQNAGPGAARNRGIKEASYDWIAFLDHDDAWLPEKLARQMVIAQQENADVVYCAAKNVGSTDRVDELRPAPVRFDSQAVYKELLADNFVTLSSVLIRRSVIDKHGGFDERWRGVEDWALWLRLAREGCRFIGLNEALVIYNWGDASLSRANDRMQEQRKLLIDEELSTKRGKSLPMTTRRRILAAERVCSAWFMADSSQHKASRLYMQAIAHWPFSPTPWKGLAKSLLRLN